MHSAHRGAIRVAITSLVATAALALTSSSAAALVLPRQITIAGNGVTLQAWIYAPSQPGQHPGVVAMHGCAGLTGENGKPNERHEDWGQRLAAQGFVVLFPDGFASRGLGPQCKVGEREVRPSHERVDDAMSALAYLVAQPNVKPQAVSLLGWSNGGSTVLYTVEPRHAPRGGPDFAKAVAFYPGCRVPLETGTWKSRMPLLILIGVSDDWTPAAPCGDLAAAAKAGGLPVDIVTYPDSYHDFDHPNLPVHLVEGLAFTGSGTGVVHTGTNQIARADALVRSLAFFAH
jgi:dienelactone hydrolase